MADLEVGDVLWFVPWFGVGEPREVTVTKVGPLYADCGQDLPGYRVRIAGHGVVAKGHGIVGHCHDSQAEYEAMISADRAWSALNTHLDTASRPASVTLDDINAAAKLLGVGL
jgi:hypothetical protein